MIDYNKINDFIIKVFNYYNGKINIINKAVLDINWANQMTSNIGGYSALPNIVKINPSVIIRFYNDEFYIKIHIIETIIHELYHTDQLINYVLYASDKNYNIFIENACEVQTTIYIINHLQEICDVFDFNSIKYDKNSHNKFMMIHDLPGVKYQRRYYYDHIFMCIDDMSNITKEVAIDVYQFIKDNINNRDDIIMIINNEEFDICVNKQLMPIEEFNNKLHKYICTGVHNASHKITYNRVTKKLVISMKTEILNLMCKKV